MADLARSTPNYIIDTAPAGIARWQTFPMHDYPLLHRLVARRYYGARHHRRRHRVTPEWVRSGSARQRPHACRA